MFHQLSRSALHQYCEQYHPTRRSKYSTNVYINYCTNYDVNYAQHDVITVPLVKKKNCRKPVQLIPPLPRRALASSTVETTTRGTERAQRSQPARTHAESPRASARIGQKEISSRFTWLYDPLISRSLSLPGLDCRSPKERLRCARAPCMLTLAPQSNQARARLPVRYTICARCRVAISGIPGRRGERKKEDSSGWCDMYLPGENAILLAV